jgi:hypothetical protein
MWNSQAHHPAPTTAIRAVSSILAILLISVIVHLIA